ncbi:MAG: CvpA family protein [Pseudomonadota bacterium]
MHLTTIDLVLLGIIAFSALISILRGFMKEMISLLSWVAAFVVSIFYAAHLAPFMPASMDMPSMRLAASFLILFILTLIVGGIINAVVGLLVKKTGLSGSDRSIGVVFGLVRGVFLVSVLILLGSLTPMPQDPWWKESQVIQHLTSVALWMRDLLPNDLAQNFRL